MGENKKWQEVIKLAEKYNFIHFCYGGVAILVEDKERGKNPPKTPKTIEGWKIKLKKMNDDKVLHDYRMCPECLKNKGKLFEVFEEEGFFVCSNCEKKYYNG